MQLDRFEALTFDCYGTLIDWESGLLAALRTILGERGHRLSDDQLLEAHARHEARWESGPYCPYREVLARTLRDMLADFGVEATDDEGRLYAESVADWPPFPDSPAALVRLARRFRLGVITNCDDDLFEHSRARLGVDFEWVITAQQARSYKPSPHNFELALQTIGLPRESILHVAQSLYHDHVPAKSLGLATAWIDRRRNQPGFGATPPASAQPDLALPDLTSLAELAPASAGSDAPDG
jgi:2-haloacid dehalogenase